MDCFSFVCLKNISSKPSEATVVRQTAQGLSNFRILHLYSSKELRSATHSFRATNKIGEGGYGSVYKGKLGDGSVIAVKVLSAESRQGEKEFLTEIDAMSNVSHENLLRLRGCCVDGTNRILVYDYMQNNSIAQTLLGGDHLAAKFSWNVRRKISFGTARALAYLHEEVRPHIVHRDIKASNILLDPDFSPKISDFGLAKLFPDNITHISTRVAGTLGYLAPEYAIRGRLTRKSDVYSFGVLLLEILSGRSVSNFNLELEEKYLVEKAYELYKAGELLQLMDPMLKGEFPDEEAIRFLKVGLLCVQETPSLRPQMSMAVKMMSNEVETDDIQILQPGLITDFMNMKIGHKPSSQSSTSRGSTSLTMSSPSFIT